MPVTTKQDKLSVLNLGNPWPGPLFNPDGSIDDGDKQHVLNLYSGLEIVSVVTSILGPFCFTTQLFSSGATQSEYFTPGPIASQIHSGGSVEQDVRCR